MRPQPGNALQEGREKKGDSDTDLRGEINVLLLLLLLLLLLRLRVLARGGVWIWPVGGSWKQTWGLRPGGSRR